MTSINSTHPSPIPPHHTTPDRDDENPPSFSPSLPQSDKELGNPWSGAESGGITDGFVSDTTDGFVHSVDGYGGVEGMGKREGGVSTPLLEEEKERGEEEEKEKEKEKEITQKKPPRLVALDVFRGVTVALMIAVDEGGDAFPHIDHSPWDGFTLADCVMPFFLFIMGTAIPLAIRISSQTTMEEQVEHSKRVIIRCCKLFLIGLLYSNFPCFYWDTLRISGILQRLSWGYLICGLCHIWMPEFKWKGEQTSLWFRYLYSWLVVLGFTLLYLFLIFMAAPFCQHGALLPGCNTPKVLDPLVLGGKKHLYPYPTYLRTSDCSSCSPGYCPKEDAPEWCSAPWDPEGPTTSMGVIFTTFLGCFAGYVVKNVVSWKERLGYWLGMGGILAVLTVPTAFLLMPLNKNMWSLSYQFLTGSMAFVCLSLCYLLVDIMPERVLPRITIFVRYFFLPAKWMGMNPLFIFLLATTNIPFWLIWGPLKSGMGEKSGTVLFIVLQLLFWFITAGYLYKIKWFWKV